MRARTISRIMLGFLVVFLLCCALFLALHLFWIWPKQRCEASGAWWSPEDWKCAVPIELQKLTGRPVDNDIQNAFKRLPDPRPRLDGSALPAPSEAAAAAN